MLHFCYLVGSEIAIILVDVKMKDQINITIRIQSPVVSNYYRDKNLFRTKNYAAERAAEIYPHTRKYTLNTLREQFQKVEIKLLIRILSSEKDPGFVTSVDMFILKIKETVKLMSLKDDEEEMIKRIIIKIKKMNFYHVVVLSEWLVTYIAFDAAYKGKKSISFNDYVKKLI